MLWRTFLRPLLFCLPAESAHHFALSTFHAASRVPPLGHWIARRYSVDDTRLAVDRFGLRFANPVGLAAGFDKNGIWFDSLAKLGFGFIEIGTLTAHAQPGNPRPRMFRLPADRAIINRLGFNNRGSEWAADRLAHREIRQLLGVNIGKSKITQLSEAPGDYQISFERLFGCASYFTINVSSPNTPGLRQLQNRSELEKIVRAVQTSNVRLAGELGQCAKPILLKIAPDLNDQQLSEIADMSLSLDIDGIIATNTTISRSGLKTAPSKLEKLGAGGLSGRPLTQRSRQMVGALYERLGDRVPLVGCGGVMNGPDAWKMLGEGASLIQVYTGLIYGGPGFVRDVNRYLVKRLDESGWASVEDAVGHSHHRREPGNFAVPANGPLK